MYKLVMAEKDLASVGLPIFWAVLGVLILIVFVIGGGLAYNEVQRMRTAGKQERSRIPDNFSFNTMLVELKKTSADFYDGKLGDLRKRYMHQGSHRYNKLNPVSN